MIVGDGRRTETTRTYEKNEVINVGFIPGLPCITHMENRYIML